ncbi:hypothetical protein [Candidatus Coxiella mudrowiae]|uniref:hypothetical protein n=1 Tax=Candidatus Coxiella mudrowiae TaxID=2054173 RepID=UPI00069E1A9C|nr:hypothetical protein [Candidatus Coxiella mudrowiae]
MGTQEPVNVSSPDHNYANGLPIYGVHLCAYPEFEFVPVKPGDTWSQLFPNERGAWKWLSALTELILS